MVNLARRGFLRGQPRPKAEVRPPWALTEVAFVAACTRCAACLTACPQGIVVAGDGGYPTIDFGRGECTFCGDCAAVCEPRALRRADAAAPWNYVAHISEDCLPKRGVECRICGDFCEARAIRFQPAAGGAWLPVIEPAACTACGACVAPCPTRAITVVTATA